CFVREIRVWLSVVFFVFFFVFFFSSRRRHTRSDRDWSSDVCSSDLSAGPDGRSGKSSRTILAGSAGSSPVASLCLASQSVWLEGIKKAPELAAQEPVEKSESARGASLLAIKR